MRDVAGKDRSLAGVLSSGFGLRSAAEVMGDLFAASSCPLWPRQDWLPLGSGPSCPERWAPLGFAAWGDSHGSKRSKPQECQPDPWLQHQTWLGES